ncbi:MAG: type II toxin-antitoxin system MqsR family toxin [Oceanococcus sp.]|nr:MAG: type II toxin-antitoxin system MqsR family toxin [Oceanococcus sp.]
MVTLGEQRRDYPAYALAAIHELAKQQKLILESRKVQNDVGNLGYSIEEVCRCIAGLRDADFSISILYPGEKKWSDVYLKEFRASGRDDADHLYIKLRVPRGQQVVLFSFHLEGSVF